MHDVDTFASENNLGHIQEDLRKGALIAQNPHSFENLDVLTEEDKAVMRNERDNKWRCDGFPVGACAELRQSSQVALCDDHHLLDRSGDAGLGPDRQQRRQPVVPRRVRYLGDHGNLRSARPVRCVARMPRACLTTAQSGTSGWLA